MFQIIGIVMLFAMVFGSFLLHGGKMDVILKTLPYELMAIFGAAIAAFLISQSMTVIKATISGFGKVFHVTAEGEPVDGNPFADTEGAAVLGMALLPDGTWGSKLRRDGTVEASNTGDFLKAKADKALSEGQRLSAIAQQLSRVRAPGQVAANDSERRAGVQGNIGSMWSTTGNLNRATELDAQNVQEPWWGQLGKVALGRQA